MLPIRNRGLAVRARRILAPPEVSAIRCVHRVREGGVEESLNERPLCVSPNQCGLVVAASVEVLLIGHCVANLPESVSVTWQRMAY